MDSEDKFVPIVEDDQGEGYKDLLEEEYAKLMNIGDNILEHLVPKPSATVRSPAELNLAAKIISEGNKNSRQIRSGDR